MSTRFITGSASRVLTENGFVVRSSLKCKMFKTKLVLVIDIQEKKTAHWPGPPAFVDTSSYVASCHKKHFGTVCKASVLIWPRIQRQAAGLPTMANEQSISLRCLCIYPKGEYQLIITHWIERAENIHCWGKYHWTAGRQFYKYGFNFFTTYKKQHIFFLVSSSVVKLETSCTVKLTPIVSVLWREKQKVFKWPIVKNKNVFLFLLYPRFA